MKIKLKSGKYVLAVSGGVDSVVLLDMLYKQIDNPKKSLTVAHFDHGIRENSAEDRKFVGGLAERYGLAFFYEEGHLGSQASEATAREKRYEFLKKVKEETGSDAIVTAHHKDDVLETIVINLLRGTGRRGLSSLGSTKGLSRPLLELSKDELVAYANKNNLVWREDETNEDQRYLRNYIRHNLLKKLSREQKQTLLDISRKASMTNREIDDLIRNLFPLENGIGQEQFNSLNHNLAAELVANWLREERLGFDKKTVERLVIRLKAMDEKKIIQAGGGRHFMLKNGIIRMNTSGSV